MTTTKQRKMERQRKKLDQLAFTPSTKIRLDIHLQCQSQSPDAVHLLRSLPSGWCAIPNTGSQEGEPHYAAFRLTNMIKGTERSALRFRVQQLWKSHLPSHIIKARGSEFHQWWFGIWTRYAAHPVISADSRKDPKREILARLLLDTYDTILGSKMRTNLRHMDSNTAKSMAYTHRRAGRHLDISKKRWEADREAEIAVESAGEAKKCGGRDSFAGTGAAMEQSSSRQDYRLGGMGTMLAVSWGEGTDWHRDAKDLSECRPKIPVRSS